MKTPQNDRSASLRGRRGIMLFVAGALAVGLGVAGVHAALAGGSSSLRSRPDPTRTITPAPVAPAAVTQPVTPVTSAQPSPTAEPASDPTALADGIYPTYVRAVDVRAATITVDVIQFFEGPAARQAAIEDGISRRDARYLYLYVRNENDLLRTLPVAGDVRIEFIGECMAPNRWAGLKQLREETRPFTTTYLYEVSVVDGTVDGIVQKIAVQGC